MSDFLHEPEDEFKTLIDDFFVKKQEAKAKKGPTQKVKLPDAPAVPKEKQEALVKIGLQEMEHVRECFLEFQDAISDTAVYAYLFPHIEQFADIAQQLVDAIEDNIVEEDLTDVGLVGYERLQQVRNRILDQINNKYKA